MKPCSRSPHHPNDPAPSLLPDDGAASDAFADANRLFKAGDYSKAAAAYENIIASDGPRASVYFNLGNSYQKLKQHGPAILAYERARLITPRDPDLLANLARARKAAAAFEEIRIHPRLDDALNFLSRNEWSWLVAGAALYLGACGLVFGFIRLPRGGMRQALIAFACMAVLAIISGSIALHLRRDEAIRGVVLTENATVRLSPFDAAESLGTPGPGKFVYLRGTNGGFRYIEVPGSNLRGWLANKDVAALIPDDPASSGIHAAKTP